MSDTRNPLQVPFFRPEIGEAEIAEVVQTLRSGWLTTGPKTRAFERAFAEAVGAPHGVALNSATAALHLAVEALGLRPGQLVLVPTLTFAATAEIVRYLGAIPLLVDCDPVTLQLDLADARAKLRDLRDGRLPPPIPRDAPVTGIVPVHVGGYMMDLAELRMFAEEHRLWVVEDAAHAFPAAWRPHADAAWQRCGERSALVSCFSFYANKTITTGEGGMATTHDPALADRMRLMSLHGLSHDAWERYSGGRSWDYRIVAPGFKYNLTDIASSIGLHQLARAEDMRRQREVIAGRFLGAFAGDRHVELPATSADRLHSWHLFPIRLRLESLAIDRNTFIDELRASGVGCSVHWRPLHLHPYYQDTFGWAAEHCPKASATWARLVSLPIFSGMRDAEVEHVIATVKRIAERHAR